MFPYFFLFTKWKLLVSNANKFKFPLETERFKVSKLPREQMYLIRRRKERGFRITYIFNYSQTISNVTVINNTSYDTWKYFIHIVHFINVIAKEWNIILRNIITSNNVKCLVGNGNRIIPYVYCVLKYHTRTRDILVLHVSREQILFYYSLVFPIHNNKSYIATVHIIKA